MKKLFLLGFTLLAAVIFLSCEKEKDTLKPVIKLNSPAQNAELKVIGNDHGIHFDAEFSDNEALASYAVDIHANFDGHTHSAARAEHAEDGVPFSYKKVFTSIDGKMNDHVHHHEIVIPEKDKDGKPFLEGKYHIIVQCLDKAGNQSQVAHDIVLLHSDGGHDGHEH